MDSSLTAQTSEKLNEAIQDHFAALYGPGVVVDWMVGAEVVHDDDTRGLRVAASEHMTAWKLRGMSYMINHYVHAVTS